MASTNFKSHVEIAGRQRATGHFRCSKLAPVQIHAPDCPSKRSHVRASHGGPHQATEVSPRRAALDAGLVPGRPWASESEPRVNFCGPRCLYRRDYTFRCLTDDVVDDGAVFVLFIADFQISVEISRQIFAARWGRRGVWNGGPGRVANGYKSFKFIFKYRGGVQ